MELESSVTPATPPLAGPYPRGSLKSVTSALHYFKSPVPTTDEYAIYDPADYETQLEPHEVSICEARQLNPHLSIDREGFVLATHQHPTIDFQNASEIRAVYYPFAAQLVKDMTGARKVIACKHNLRMSQTRDETPTAQLPVWRVHTDCTDRSGFIVARAALAEAGLSDEWLKRRYAIINVWQPIYHSIFMHPLALCDATTVDSGALVETRLIRGDVQGGITYSVAYDSRHRWFYFSEMTCDEALLFKCYDSSRAGHARFVPHAAFEEPSTANDAPPRQSIEVQTLALFGPPRKRYVVTQPTKGIA